MSYNNDVLMDGVREHGEGFGVTLGERSERMALVAYNEGGHNSTLVDLLDVIAWARTNRPELLVALVDCAAEDSND